MLVATEARLVWAGAKAAAPAMREARITSFMMMLLIISVWGNYEKMGRRK
jgi:hypothetical protein